VTPGERQELLTMAARLREGLIVELPADYGEIRQRTVGERLAGAARRWMRERSR